MTKKRMPMLEAALKTAYNKDITVFKQLIVHGGSISRAICWFTTPLKEIAVNECYRKIGKDIDTDCVQVIDGTVIKEFYQGEYEDGKPGAKSDYHGNNAYITAEQYAMGLL